MQDTYDDGSHRTRDLDRHLLIVCGWIGIAGTLTVVAGNVIGSLVVPGHDFVADTISDLAAGKYEIIQDIALYGYAGALIAAALGAAHAHPGGKPWTLGVLSLAVLAGAVVVIGARNEYGDHDSDGVVVHIYVVYLIGLLVAVAFISMARGVISAPDGFRTLSWICAALWIVGGPAFFFMPTDLDGAWERALGLVMVVWTIALAWSLIRLGRTVPD